MGGSYVGMLFSRQYKQNTEKYTGTELKKKKKKSHFSS